MNDLSKLLLEKFKKMKNDPCWKNYKMVGMKKGKGGKPVPNCVPESTEIKERFLSATGKPDDNPLAGQHDNKIKTVKTKPPKALKPMVPKKY